MLGRRVLGGGLILGHVPEAARDPGVGDRRTCRPPGRVLWLGPRTQATAGASVDRGQIDGAPCLPPGRTGAGPIRVRAGRAARPDRGADAAPWSAARRARGPPHAGALAGRAHPDRVHGHRLPGHDPLRRGALPAHPRRDLQGARQALVEGGARHLRRRRHHRHDPVVRVRPALAGVHRELRAGVRRRLRPGGHLVLPRGHLHRDLCLRLGPAARPRALPHRRADRDHGAHRLVHGDRGQRLDEKPAGLRRRQRQGRQPAAVGGAVQPQPVARDRPHVRGGLHRRRLPRLGRVRPCVAEGPARALSPHGPRRGAHLRRARRAGAGDRRRLGGAPGRRVAAGQAGHLRGPRKDPERRAVHDRRLLRHRAGEGALRGRGAQAALAAGPPRPERARDRAGLRAGERPPAGQRRALRLPDDDRDRHAARAARRLLPGRPAQEATAAAVAAVLLGGGGGRAAVGGRADRRLDHHRGGPPAVDRLPGHAHVAGGHRRRRPRGRLRRPDRGLPEPGRGGRVAAAPPRLAPARGGGRGAPAPARGGPLMWADLCLGFLVAGVTAYAVLGSADFGAGFWDLTAGGARRGGRIRGLIQRSMSPVWEANHVWLIFVIVIAWTAFPVAFGSVFSTLRVPLFLAAIGIIFRGGAFALRGQAATIREARLLGGLFALSSVLIPYFLGAAIGGVASGRVQVGNATGAVWDSWINPTSAVIGALAVVTGAFLAAVYLAGDARRAEQPDLERAFRTRALAMGVVAGAVAIGGLFILRDDARDLYDGLTSGRGLLMVIVSALAGAATLALIALSRFGLARLTAAVAVAAVTVGWVFAQDPHLLPGSLTFEDGAASDATLQALVIGVGIGSILLLPSLWFLYRLVLQGRLDQSYEPLDQRFRPADPR